MSWGWGSGRQYGHSLMSGLAWQVSSGWRHGRARVHGPSSGGGVLGWFPLVGFPAAPHCLHPPSPEPARVGPHGGSVSWDCLFCLLPCTHFGSESAICFTSRSSAHCPVPFSLMHLRRSGPGAISGPPEKGLMTSVCLEVDEKQVPHEACLAALDQAISESHHLP